jgi:hypothetical protein
MKKCSHCGLENPDEATQCAGCHTVLSVPASPDPSPSHSAPVTSLQVRRFWERMTFRQFVVLFMRLQAVWLLWYAAIDLTYLPDFLRAGFAGVYIDPVVKLDFFLLLLRIILHVAAAVAVIRYADGLVNWLVRDWIRNQPPNTALEPTATALSVSDEPSSSEAGGDSTSSSSGRGSALDR